MRSITNIPENSREKTLAALQVGTPGILKILGSDMLHERRNTGKGKTPGRALHGGTDARYICIGVVSVGPVRVGGNRRPDTTEKATPQ